MEGGGRGKRLGGMGYIIRYAFNHDNGTTQIVDMNISKACDEVYTCMLGGGPPGYSTNGTNCE